ncbi:MAG: hypothetical protein KDA65_17980, partial [Planctomycetaceae bacterium]|nr:hypothetical protein [Planctomycetaceae bacterium]
MQIFLQTPATSGLAPLDHFVIGVYLIAMLSMGFVIAFRQKSTDDFFLAGRNLPAWAVGISLMASLLSTITYLATPGEMFRSGPSYMLRVLGIPLVLLSTWFIWIPFFMRLRLTSAYEYLERRFNYTTRAMAAFFCLILILGWMAVVVLTASKAMTEIVQLDLDWFFGKNIAATQTTEDGSSIFVSKEMLNAPEIAGKLMDGADDPSSSYGRIYQLLTPEERTALSESSNLPETLRDIFNRLLLAKDLYDKNVWSDEMLSPTARNFTGVDRDKLTPQELTHFNRAIIESTFPATVAATTPAYADADMHALIISIGLFSVLYTTLGGLRAVVWTDVVQFVVLMLGAFLTIGIVSWETGSSPSDWLQVVSERKYEKVDWYSFDIADRSNVLFIIIGMFFWTFCTHGSNQVALQRYFATRNVREGRKSYLVNAIADVTLTVVLGCVGMSLVYFVLHSSLLPATPDLHSAVDAVRNEAQDSVFPQFIRVGLPAGIRGLVVAALFAAAMSTIDSGANSISTIVTVDYYRPFSKGQTTAAGELRLARALTASMGLLIVISTIFIYHLAKGSDLITLCQKGFNCFLGPLGGLFFV